MNKLKTENFLNSSTAIFVLALGFVIAMHQIAFQDRMVLILFYLAVAGSAYSLIKRGSLGLASIIVALSGAMMFAQLYYQAKPDAWHPILDSIRDMVGLGGLLYLTIRLLIVTYAMQREEKERRVRQAMEERLVAMRAEALRHTSHEVRTPLSTITAITETLLDGSTGEMNEAQHEFVGDIDNAAHHLLGLVNDILDYAKAEAGMIRLAPEPVALVELVNQCVTMVTPRAKAAGVSISAHISPEREEIIADPLRLRQIILNLLSNAVKYNEQGGTVVLRVLPHEKTGVCISVRDTGRGIAPEHLEYLFEPYYQAAITDQGIGTGLGLAIIKHLTELHGGSVVVESVVDAGTKFVITLPGLANCEVAKTPDQELALSAKPMPQPASNLLSV